MPARILKNVAFFAVAILAISFGSPTIAQGGDTPAKALSKADVEAIVHDYIVTNPQVILLAVDDYQKKSMKERQNTALDKNKDILFKDVSSPEVGNSDGDVTIVEFFDYNCHFCKVALPLIEGILEKDKKVRFVLKDFPILGPTSEAAAKWALAAQKQKKYFEFHKALMNSKQPINDALLEKIAADLGMDTAQAKTDIAGTEILLQIEKNRSLAGNLGLNGTPAFIIGDEVLPGAPTLEGLEQKIAEQRKKAAAKK